MEKTRNFLYDKLGVNVDDSFLTELYAHIEGECSINKNTKKRAKKAPPNTTESNVCHGNEVAENEGPDCDTSVVEVGDLMSQPLFSPGMEDAVGNEVEMAIQNTDCETVVPLGVMQSMKKNKAPQSVLGMINSNAHDDSQVREKTTLPFGCSILITILCCLCERMEV